MCGFFHAKHSLDDSLVLENLFLEAKNDDIIEEKKEDEEEEEEEKGKQEHEEERGTL